jgi:murein tripeptide amidase MpaA
MDLGQYYTNEQLSEMINKWKEDFPDLLEIREIGQSYEKRPIYLLIITNQSSGTDLDKPAIWIDANIHATEITGTTVALGIAHTLLEGNAANPAIKQLLDRSVYYILPRMNPDGAAWCLAENPKFIRSGVRPYPYHERDEGLHDQDIDGDGRVLEMRLPDKNGDWKMHAEHPDLLVKRDPGEFGGEYFRIFSEGLLEDYDGYLIKVPRPLEGLDFNRNFPFDWKPEADQMGAGPFPGSEPEIRAVLEFITTHPNINVAITYHTFSRVILRPFSTRPDDEMETADLWVYQLIGTEGTRQTGYRAVSTYHDFLYHPKEVTTGAFDDWMYDHLGIFAFTIELWDLPTEAGIKDRKFIDWFREHPVEDDVTIYEWAKENTGDEGYVPWYRVDHPQLGEIELGGWNTIYTWRNPPPGVLQSEVERNIPFAIWLGQLLPHLETHQLSAKKIGPNTYHIDLVVENSGYFSTSTTVQSRKRKAARPITFELELPEGARLLEGKRKVKTVHLEGRSNKLVNATVWSASPTDNRCHVEWVIEAQPNSIVRIQVKSDRAENYLEEIQLD